jgi:hypothetical protein
MIIHDQHMCGHMFLLRENHSFKCMWGVSSHCISHAIGCKCGDRDFGEAEMCGLGRVACRGSVALYSMDFVVCGIAVLSLVRVWSS